MLCKRLGARANMEEHHPLPHSPRGERACREPSVALTQGSHRQDKVWLHHWQLPVWSPEKDSIESFPWSSFQSVLRPAGSIAASSPSTATGDEAVLPVSPPSCRQHSGQEGIKQGEHQPSPCSSGQPWLGSLADGYVP